MAEYFGCITNIFLWVITESPSSLVSDGMSTRTSAFSSPLLFTLLDLLESSTLSGIYCKKNYIG